jgi:hypothetical protein
MKPPVRQQPAKAIIKGIASKLHTGSLKGFTINQRSKMIPKQPSATNRHFQYFRWSVW